MKVYTSKNISNNKIAIQDNIMTNTIIHEHSFMKMVLSYFGVQLRNWFPKF